MIQILTSQLWLFYPQISELQNKLEFTNTTMIDKSQMMRLEGKARDLESRLALEQTTRQKFEVM